MWLYNGEEPPVFDPPPEEEQEVPSEQRKWPLTGTISLLYSTIPK